MTTAPYPTQCVKWPPRSGGVSHKRRQPWAYRFYAPVYDRFFAPSFADGHARMYGTLAPSEGERVLEVGVGTGISLGHYPGGVEVDAIDYSKAMLRKAERRLARTPVPATVRLHHMDAHRLEFDDNIFDHCLVAHALTVVQEPEVVLREMLRVTRPGGRLVIVNYYRDRIGLMARVWDPFRRRVGLGRNVDIEALLEAQGLEIIDDQRVNRLHCRMFTTRIPAENGGGKVN